MTFIIDLKCGLVYIDYMARILIAEDEQELRDLYSEVLTTAGFEVDQAEDGQVALQKIKSGGYNLVLLDVMMPLLDGLGVLTDLTSQNPPLTNLPPIVMWSNLSHEPAVEQAMQMGAKEYLVKANITPDQLIAVVQKYAGTSQSGAAAAQPATQQPAPPPQAIPPAPTQPTN